MLSPVCVECLQTGAMHRGALPKRVRKGSGGHRKIEMVSFIFQGKNREPWLPLVSDTVKDRNASVYTVYEENLFLFFFLPVKSTLIFQMVITLIAARAFC